MRLTDLSIRKLGSPSSGQKTYYDDALPGFGIRISQGGTKSYVVMYGTKRRLKTIGRYPDLKLADARREAKRIQSDLTLLNMASTSMPAPVSFDAARDRFITHCESKNKPRTVQDYSRLLSRHFSFKKDIAEISRKDVMAVVSSLSATPSESQHAYVAIRTMMNWCVTHGLLETSPVPPMSFKKQSRDRILSDEELSAVYRRAQEFYYPFGPIFQLLVLTGQRRSEIAGLRWSWINDSEITFPQGFTKNKREHRLPVGRLVQSVLNELPESGDFLFPSRYSDEKPFNGWGKAKEAFDDPLSFSDYTLHDLRRTYSSTMAKLGVPIHVTEKLLNHVSGSISGVAAVYNRHSYWDEMREAVAAYDDYISRLAARG
jgi:integrase